MMPEPPNPSGTQTAGISRRAVLKGAASLTLASLAAPLQAQGSPGRRDVLVLGAGMAGLTAALALLRQGHHVTVLEYQNRIGGRLLSLPLPGGQFTEAGGGHFRSNMPYVLSYIRHFGLPIHSLNDGLPRYLIQGQMGDGAHLGAWPWDVAPSEKGVTVASSLNRYLYRAGLDTDTVLDARWPDPATLAQLDSVTVGDLIRNVGASEAFCRLLEAHGGTFTTASQALGTIPDLAYHFGDHNLFRIQGGNQRLPEALARAIGSERIESGLRAARQIDPAARPEGRALLRQEL